MCLEREEALRNKRKVCFSYIKLVYNIRYQLNQSSEVHVAIYCTLTEFLMSKLYLQELLITVHNQFEGNKQRSLLNSKYYQCKLY